MFGNFGRPVPALPWILAIFTQAHFWPQAAGKTRDLVSVSAGPRQLGTIRGPPDRRVAGLLEVLQWTAGALACANQLVLPPMPLSVVPHRLLHRLNGNVNRHCLIYLKHTGTHPARSARRVQPGHKLVAPSKRWSRPQACCIPDGVEQAFMPAAKVAEESGFSR
jgi:hypothetical protein